MTTEHAFRPPTHDEPSLQSPDTHRSKHPNGHLWRSRWAAIGAAVAVTIGAGGFVGLVNAAASAPSDVVAITPVRVLDTRDGVDVGLAGPFVSPVGQDLQITGSIPTTAGPQVVVPAGATAVLLNVTAVSPQANGFISVRPADAPGAPATSSLNFAAGETVPNAVTVAVPTAGADLGKIEITYDALGTAGPRTDVLIDVVGYTLAAPPGVAPANPPLIAVVEQSGALVRGSAGTTSQLLAGVPDGRYAVVFDRDISQCVYQATVGRPGVNVGPPIGFAMVANWADNPTNGVIVFVKDQTGAGANRAFHLTVNC